MPQRNISVFAQQPDETLFILITALDTVPAQRVRRLVKSVVRGVVHFHFSNVLSFLRMTSRLLSLYAIAPPPAARYARADHWVHELQADTATWLILEYARLLMHAHYARGAAMILHSPPAAQAAQSPRDIMTAMQCRTTEPRRPRTQSKKAATTMRLMCKGPLETRRKTAGPCEV